MLLLANDYFLMWEKSRIIGQKMDLYILPQRLKKEGQRLALAVEKIMQIPAKDAEITSFEFKKYRDYENRDSLKSIDWKKSAKTSKLTVREDYPEREPQNVLIFWGENGENFEHSLAIFNSMYEVLDPTDFQQVFLVGEKSYVGKHIDKKWLAELEAFTQMPKLELLSKVRERNVYLFSVGTSANLNRAAQFLRQHNEIIYLNLKSPELLLITSRYFSRQVYLEDYNEN
ncbi:hypothetical protein XA3_03580 [Xylocopilactobacillus apicola]|uniref:DUF58 domain-containing protein n=1 Tax=Xylocopilactobacillus apicola TaxID=2932184 RepID=A0AAU9DAR3_9LACO|nr:hypothetical protein XA3_03580 [Xylocopilactobacillus apicola]